MAREPIRYFVDLPSLSTDAVPRGALPPEPQRYELLTLKGHEGLSQTARFEATFHVSDTDPLDPDALISGPATLVLSRAGSVREVALYVTSVRRTATRKVRGHAGGGKISLVLEPRLAMLRKRTDIRVFRNKTAPQIVVEVLSQLGVKVDNSLRDSYVSRPYTVEFRESDYDFAARLLEDEGIFYFVADDGTVVLGDHPTKYLDRVGVLPFRAAAGLDQNEDSVHAIGQRGAMTAGKVSLRDFNYEHPSLNMDVSADGPTEGGAEWYDYPGEYTVPAEGQVKAAKRAEALACVHRRVVAKSFCAELRPAARFQLTEAPMGVREGGYVVTKVLHDYQRDREGFSVELECLTESTTYRPECVTPVPTQPNLWTGFTTGPAGADIYPDKWGQVKVWFPWDRLQARKGDPDVSHWVPTIQDNTGRSSAIMRTDWEVVCQFMEGDPDRPIIIGRVFNGYEAQFTELPENKTRTGLRSQTSPRTEDGANYIQFEDRAGYEAILIGATKDQNIVIANDKNEQTDEANGAAIYGNESIDVGNDATTTIENTCTPSVVGNQQVDISGDLSIETGGGIDIRVAKDNKLTISGNHTRNAKLSEVTQVKKDLTEEITGDVTEQSKQSNSMNVGKESKLIVKGSHTERAKQTKTESSGTKRTEEITGKLMETAGKEMATRIEDKRKLTVAGDVTVTAEKNVLLAGSEKYRQRSDTVVMNGDCTFTIKVGETQIKLENNQIEMLAVENIEFVMSGRNEFKTSTSKQDLPEGE